MLKDSFDLRSEDEAAIAMIEVKRLDADAIADKHELFSVCVPDGDRVVAFDVVNEVEAAFFIEMEDRFRVGARGVTVAALFEAGAELFVVVDFSVEDKPRPGMRAIVAAAHRLVTGW